MNDRSFYFLALTADHLDNWSWSSSILSASSVGALGALGDLGNGYTNRSHVQRPALLYLYFIDKYLYKKQNQRKSNKNKQTSKIT